MVRAAIFLTLGASALTLQSTGLRLDRVISLGDSYSDTGNLYERTGRTHPAPPYYRGRFSNGPLWIDRLAAHYRASLENHAVAGATSDSTVFPTKPTIPGCIQQAEQLPPHPRHPRTTLLSVAFFGDDFAQNATAAVFLAKMDKCVVKSLEATHARHVLIPISPKRTEAELSEEVRDGWNRLIIHLAREFPKSTFYAFDYAGKR